MAIIDHIDPATRRIYLSASSVGTSIHPIDIYKEYRTLRATDETLRPFDSFMKADGNVPKGGGKFTERYVTLLLGTRIVPFDTSQTLTITGTIITDDGFEGTLAFDKSSLSVNTSININYIPPQVEVIQVAAGSGVTAQDKLDIAKQVWDETRGTSVVTDVDFIKQIEGGKWDIVGNEMIFYKEDNITEIARFTLNNPTAPTTRTRI